MATDETSLFPIYFPKAKPSDLNEEFLIEHLVSKGKHKAWAATLLLRRYGTIASVDALKACCLRPIQDLQITSIFTLQIIQGSKVAEFAVSLLNHKEYTQKWAAMLVACETCDSQHRAVLESRLKQVASRKQACPEKETISGKTTEVLHFLKYLQRTNQFLGPMASHLLRKQENLTPEEQQEVQRIFGLEE